MGAPKAATPLGGRPLVTYPLTALAAVCERVVVVAKQDSPLPPLAVERWDEPELPRHPAVGIRAALRRARGTPLLVCAGDMPFVTGAVLEQVAGALGSHAAAVAVSAGKLEPLLAVYGPSALAAFDAAPVDQPLRRTVEGLAPVQVEVPRGAVFNVNTPEELAEAERRLSSG